MERRLFKCSALILILLGYIALISAPGRLGGDPEVALAASDPVIAVAGNIACDPINSGFNGGNGTATTCRQKYTSDLLVNQNLAAVLTLGDNQYECGSLQAFRQSYDLSWGRVKSITHPSLGNHDYLTSGTGTGCRSANAGAAGNFDYFGAAAGPRGQGYYSFDIGAWHIIALNSNCSAVGGCSASSPQGQWLQNDLATHTNMCTLAYFHHPLFSSGVNSSSRSLPFWQLLHQYNAELILNGHDHIYERFAPQSPTGTADPIRGIRQFTVGTGGRSHHTISQVASSSQVRNANTFGVLKLTLHPTSYDWQFVPEAGGTFTDSGGAPCNAPTIPIATSTATLTPSATPGKATLISPAGTITNTQPTFTWNRVSSATWYYLWINGPSGNVFKNWYSTVDANCNGNTCSIIPAGLTFSSGDYTWWIQTWNDAGYGPWSEGMTFNLPAPPLPGRATLVSPTGSIVTNTPTYSWNAVNGATWYYLWVSQVNAIGSLTTIQSQWYEATQVCSGGSCVITPVGITLSGGNYRWWVQTWNNAGYGPWSDATSFSTP